MGEIVDAPENRTEIEHQHRCAEREDRRPAGAAEQRKRLPGHDREDQSEHDHRPDAEPPR